MEIRGSVVSLSFIFPHPPEDKQRKSRKKVVSQGGFGSEGVELWRTNKAIMNMLRATPLPLPPPLPVKTTAFVFMLSRIQKTIHLRIPDNAGPGNAGIFYRPSGLSRAPSANHREVFGEWHEVACYARLHQQHGF